MCPWEQSLKSIFSFSIAPRSNICYFLDPGHTTALPRGRQATGREEMSQGLNKAQIIGNLGQNPELRYTQGGTAVMTLRVATNEKFKKDGEWTDRTEWHSVVVWGKRAEGLSKVVGKGTQLYVEGRLQTRQWDDKEGVKRYTTEIVASDILLLGRKGDSSGAGSHDGEGSSSSKGGTSKGGGGDGGDGYNGPETSDYSDDEIPF